MSIDDVFKSLVLDRKFSTSEKLALEDAVRFLYGESGSPLSKPTPFAKYVEQWISDPSNIIVVAKSENGSFFLPPSGETGGLPIIAFDFDDVGGLYIDRSGTAQIRTVDFLLAHELMHLIFGTDDKIDIPSGDFMGDTVRLANQVYKSVGLPEQISYIAQDPTHDLVFIDGFFEPAIALVEGFRYTGGQEIDGSIVWASSEGFVWPLDTQAAGNSRDLLVGGPLSDMLRAGAGDDYLYGSGDNDTLHGGQGNDRLYGGSGESDVALYDGSCLEYNITRASDGSIRIMHARGDRSDGSDHLESIEIARFSDGKEIDLTAEQLHGCTRITLLETNLVGTTTGGILVPLWEREGDTSYPVKIEYAIAGVNVPVPPTNSAGQAPAGIEEFRAAGVNILGTVYEGATFDVIFSGQNYSVGSNFFDRDLVEIVAPNATFLFKGKEEEEEEESSVIIIRPDGDPIRFPSDEGDGEDGSEASDDGGGSDTGGGGGAGDPDDTGTDPSDPEDDPSFPKDPKPGDDEDNYDLKVTVSCETIDGAEFCKLEFEWDDEERSWEETRDYLRELEDKGIELPEVVKDLLDSGVLDEDSGEVVSPDSPSLPKDPKPGDGDDGSSGEDGGGSDGDDGGGDGDDDPSLPKDPKPDDDEDDDPSLPKDPKPDDDEDDDPSLPKDPKPDDDEDDDPSLPKDPKPDGPNGGAFGDPHIYTLDRDYYSFHASGEFILAQAISGAEFEVQARFIQRWSSISVVEAIGVSLGGDTVSIEHSLGSDTILINGEKTDITVGERIDFDEGFVEHTTSQRFVVGNNEGDQTDVFYNSQYLDVTVRTANIREPNSFVGLLGNGNGLRGDDFRLKDGTVLPVPIATDDLYGSYALSWLVDEEDRILSGPQTPFAEPSRIVNVNSLPNVVREMAEAVVDKAGISDPNLREAAIIDYAITGNPEFVSSASNVDEIVDETIAYVEPETSSSPTILITADIFTLNESEDNYTKITAYREGNSGILTLNYELIFEDDSTISIVDFTDLEPNGEIIFLDGQDSSSIDILLKDDIIPETGSSFQIGFSLPEGETADYLLLVSTLSFTIAESDLPEPTNPVLGTNDSDYIAGSVGNDEIRSYAGSYDKMFGDIGADHFIFGAEANNGIRERDVILDYEVGLDEIVLEDGASVASIRQTSSQVVIFLEGDRDAIYVRGDGVTDDNITIVTDDLFALI